VKSGTGEVVEVPEKLVLVQLASSVIETFAVLVNTPI
jgi:hypothetical protein